MKNLEVIRLAAEGNSLPEELGISEERNIELQKKVHHGLIDHSSFTDMLVTLSKEAKHPNELAFIGFLVGGKWHEQHEMNLMKDFMKKMMKGE